MTMERNRVSRNPLAKRKTLSRVKRKIYIIWLWAIVNASPQLFFNKYVGVSAYFHSCSKIQYWQAAATLYSVFQLFSVFCVPTGIVLFCSIGVLLAYNTETALSLKRRKRYRKFVRLVLLLVVTFIITNFPKQILELIVTSNSRSHDNTTEKYFLGCVLLSWTNCLLVPILYMVMYGTLMIPKCCRPKVKNDNHSVRSHLSQIPEIEDSFISHMNLETFTSNEPKFNRKKRCPMATVGTDGSDGGVCR